MDISSFVVNHALFFVLGAMAAFSVEPTLRWLKLKDKESWVLMVQRAGPLVMAVLFVISLYVVLGPGGWVWSDFTHYQNEVVCFPANWSATLRPFSMEYSTRFEYSYGNIVFYGPANSSTINWSSTWLNWTNKTAAHVVQSPPVFPTTQ